MATHNRTGLVTAAIVGSMTNTIFVLLGIYIFFGNIYGGSFQHFLALILTTNSLLLKLLLQFLSQLQPFRHLKD